MPIEIETQFEFKAAENYPVAMRAAITRIAAQLAGELDKESPVDFGRLAASWVYEVLDPFTAIAGTDVHYARHVWLGTAHHAPPWPPWAPIAEWAERHGLPPGPIYGAIARRGIKGDPYVERAEKTTTELMPDIIEAYLRQYGVIA